MAASYHPGAGPAASLDTRTHPPHREGVRCAACDHEIALASGERVGFRDTCSRCDADLHACRECRHHDPSAANGCREPRADPVRDPERANRCEWFQAGEGGGAAEARATREGARQALDALFSKPPR